MAVHVQPLSPRLNSLLKPPYHILDDPWRDSFPSLNSFRCTGRNLRKNSFNFFMKVSELKPCEMDVKLEDGFIVIQAKQEKSEGSVGREFKRKYKIPDDISPATLHFTFENGLLKVKVDKVLADEDGGEIRLPNLKALNLREAAETERS